MHVHAGTDTYGRVKSVAGTAIVTKFAMFQFLPLLPIRSYYLIARGPTKRSGIPFFASTQAATVVGLPLASIDLASVLMAYLRGVFATLAIVGFLAIVPGIMSLSGEHLDEIAMTFTKALLASLAVGTVGGLLTYAIPLTSRRDRDIRSYCAELLGVSADPARVAPEARQLIGSWLDDAEQAGDEPRADVIRQLIATRLDLTTSEDVAGLEDQTDDLLERLRVGEWMAG